MGTDGTKMGKATLTWQGAYWVATWSDTFGIHSRQYKSRDAAGEFLVTKGHTSHDEAFETARKAVR